MTRFFNPATNVLSRIQIQQPRPAKPPSVDPRPRIKPGQSTHHHSICAIAVPCAGAAAVPAALFIYCSMVGLSSSRVGSLDLDPQYATGVHGIRIGHDGTLERVLSLICARQTLGIPRQFRYRGSAPLAHLATLADSNEGYFLPF
jgi:hypothetical protein